MKQILIITLTALLLVIVPALSSASDRHRSGRDFDSRTTVFEYGHRDHRNHDVKHVRSDDYRGRSYQEKSWKHAKRHGKHERYDRHRHGSKRYWGYSRGHRHDHDRVVYRHTPHRRTVIKERILVSPVIPVPLPPNLILHFSW